MSQSLEGSNSKQEERIAHNSATIEECRNVDEAGEKVKASRPSVKDVRPGFEDNRVSFRIPTTQDTTIHVHETHGKHSWQGKLVEFLHKPAVQYTLLGLLILDVLILFTELFLTSMYPTCPFVERDAISCCLPTGDEAAAGDHHRWLGGDSSHHFCDAGLVATDHPAGCDPHKYEAVHTAELAFFWMTVSILSIFLVELILLIAALGPMVFFRQLFYVLDLFIVVVSLALELLFHFANEDMISSYVGLLVLGRVWRFVRIGHGLMEATAEITSKRYEEIIMLAEELEDLLEKNDDALSKSEDYQELKAKTDELFALLHQEEEHHHKSVGHESNSSQRSTKKWGH